MTKAQEQDKITPSVTEGDNEKVGAVARACLEIRRGALSPYISFFAWAITIPVFGVVLRALLCPFVWIVQRTSFNDEKRSDGGSRELDCYGSDSISDFLSADCEVDFKDNRGKAWPYRVKDRSIPRRSARVNMPMATVKFNKAISAPFAIPKDNYEVIFTIESSGFVNYFIMDIRQLERRRNNKYPYQYYFGEHDVVKSKQRWTFESKGEYVIFIENTSKAGVNVEYHIYEG